MLVLILWNLEYIMYAYILIYAKFICRYLIVHSIKPVHIFKIDQILCDSEQNIDFKILQTGTDPVAASLMCSKHKKGQHTHP